MVRDVRGGRPGAFNKGPLASTSDVYPAACGSIVGTAYPLDTHALSTSPHQQDATHSKISDLGLLQPCCMSPRVPHKGATQAASATSILLPYYCCSHSREPLTVHSCLYVVAY